MRAARLWPPLDVNTVGAGYTYPPLEYLTPWVPNPRDTYLINTYSPWIPTPWDTYPPINTPQNDRRLWKKITFLAHTVAGGNKRSSSTGSWSAPHCSQH